MTDHTMTSSLPRWYYKGKGQGVQLWEPMPSMLGGPEIRGDPTTWYKSADFPTITHSRFFEASV